LPARPPPPAVPRRPDPPAALPGVHAAEAEHHRHVAAAARLGDLALLAAERRQGLHVLALALRAGAVHPGRRAGLPAALVDDDLVGVPVAGVPDVELLVPGRRAAQALEDPYLVARPCFLHGYHPLARVGFTASSS